MPKKSSNGKHNKQIHLIHPTKLSRKYNSFLCRICNRPHPLKTCRKFLSMNVADRIRAVRTNKYCGNCLAHDHSKGTCFTKHGCRTCKKFHHTLLHMHPRLDNDTVVSSSSTSSRSRSLSPPTTSKRTASGKPSSKPVSKVTSLTSILRPNNAILLPTVLVKINNKTSHARCLLDSGSPISRISKRFTTKQGLTTLTVQDETLCHLILKSRFDSNSKIEGTFRVDNRLTLQTPAKSLPESFKKSFRDIFLADSKFFESSGIDVIIGVDLYPKVICEGVISKSGMPTAQSTIFGWAIYGSCAT